MKPEDKKWQDCFLQLLEEAYSADYGKGTWFTASDPSISEVLAGLDDLTVDQALDTGYSRNSPAQHAKHLADTMEAVAKAVRGEEWRIDWGASWHLGDHFGDREWADLTARIRRAYADVKTAIQQREDWSDDDLRTGTLAMLAHAAYHLWTLRNRMEQRIR